ncbi:MAG: family transcriptional regulator [Bryobacterales bacterium]|nr:family transcriptional regulator [Bryobacterales bacterium]
MQSHTANISKKLGDASPKSISWRKFLETGNLSAMASGRADSNEAIAERLRLLRTVVSGESQTAFSAWIDIEPKRWNNFERGMPLSKEVALLLVRKIPDITLDWLFLGNENGLSVRRQREFAEAGKATMSASRSKGRG